jgi:hypothetical protein
MNILAPMVVKELFQSNDLLKKMIQGIAAKLAKHL